MRHYAGEWYLILRCSGRAVELVTLLACDSRPAEPRLIIHMLLAPRLIPANYHDLPNHKATSPLLVSPLTPRIRLSPFNT